MDLKQIEKLMGAMERSGMTRVAIEQPDGFKIELEKDIGGEVCYAPTPMPAPAAAATPQPTQESKPAPAAASGTFITSPMVGTFYTAPSPDDPAFVKVGDQVDENSVICIIEAMKVMNEVKAGVKGRIVEILVKNGEPVEFGSNIFRIES